MPGPYPLPTLAPTIDHHGVATVPFEDVLASIRAAYAQVYGSDVYLDADSQDGQWLAVQAQAVFDLGAALAAVYYSYSPTFAQGVALSSLIKINGLQRQVPTQSTVELLIGGQAHTVITNGVVQDANHQYWDLPPTVTIPRSGEITVIATAREVGQILAPAHTITQIDTLVPGWQTVTNPAAANAGVAVETDAQLRRRQHRSTGLPSITPIGGLYGMLANVEGAGRVEIYENDRDHIDHNGIPGHSIACILDGGDQVEIATVIARKKSPGCGTYGSTSVDTQDQAAMPVTINFFYTQQVEIYVEITLIPRQRFVSSTADLIKQAIALFINDQRVGFTIYRAWLAAPASLAGDIATEATGLHQSELSRLAETYVLAQILIGTDRNALDVVDIPMLFMQSGHTIAADVGVVIRQ